MKYTGPKVKLSRRLGIALTPKAVKYMEKRPYGPGQHGPNKRRKQPSVYGMQLLEKQKLKFQYNVSERQLRNYFLKATRKRGKTGEVLVQQLEMRLDAFVLRAGFAKTIYAARQYVNHGHMELNGRRVNIPSMQVKVGDVVTIRERSRENTHIREAFDYSPPPPSYIERDKTELFAKLLAVPTREDIPVICDENVIVEFYSK